VEPDALPDVLDKLTNELATLDDSDNTEAGLQQRFQALRKDYDGLATKVSKARQRAAKPLAKIISRQMHDLDMEKGEFAVKLEPADENERRAFGRESIEFLVNTNPGQPLKPLVKIASGGELSRISLAIQVVTAAVVRVPTLIFDEVDVGIGGRVAEIVGTKLRALAADRQILCITHLPQVASLGTHHLQVNKSDSETTRVAVTPLKTKERVTEIARMLGGIEVTQQSISHAKEMLQRHSA
jgi:DNA repair protein RecN (Recombination protein N)